MVGSLLAGLLFAFGHHWYYRRLDGTTVSTSNTHTSWTWSATPYQNFHIAIGTALASLVRTSLVIAVTTGYVQILWRTL